MVVELDNEYKMLIKMKYILNTKDVIDMSDLKNQVKNLVLDSKTLEDICENISDEIDERKKNDDDKPCISRITLARMFGIIQGTGISKSNKDRIAKYLGCQNWNELVAKGPESVRALMLRTHQFEVAQEMRSSLAGDDGSGLYGSNLSRLISHNVEAKNIVNIVLVNNKKMRLKKLKEDRYRIESCDSKVLKKGYTIYIPAFFVGVHLTGLYIKDETGMQVKTYYKSSGEIKGISMEYGF